MSVCLQRTVYLARGFILLLLAVSTPLFAAPEFPDLTNRVVDNAGLLPGNVQQQLITELATHERETSNQVVVVTLTSLQGYTIDDYGYQLGRHWGIGQAERNNGVLLIVAPEERKVRIEVGYGLEGTLTDALSHNIIQTVILPEFKQGDMPAGIVKGTRAIVEVLQGTYTPLPVKRVKGNFGQFFLVAFVFLLALGEWIASFIKPRTISALVMMLGGFAAGWLFTSFLPLSFILGFFVGIFHFVIGGGGSDGNGGSGHSGYYSGGYSSGSSGGGF